MQPHSIIIIADDHLSSRITDSLAESVACRIEVNSCHEWVQAVAANPGCIGVLDLDRGRVDFTSRLRLAQAQINNNQDSIFFAIIPPSQARLSRQIMKIGFAAVFSSMLDKARLNQFAVKHFKSLPSREAGIEEAVSSSLPWKP